MAKRIKPKGHSVRNGNSPAPYTKYKKAPYHYSPALRAWETAVKENRPDLAAQHDRDWHRSYDPLTGGSKRIARIILEAA